MVCLPSGATDVAIKSYVDDLVAGLKTRIIVRAATTANVNLSNALENGDTLDGISLATGNKVLVKNQLDATENGIYVVPASGAASRDSDFNTVDELAGQLSYCSRRYNKRRYNIFMYNRYRW